MKLPHIAGSFFLASLLSFLLCISANIHAQDFEWAKSFTSGVVGYNEINAVDIDNAGNVYSIGTFAGTADFDPSANSFVLTAVGDDDIFISKLDAAGNFVWAKSIGSVENDEGLGISVDNNGDVYTTGFYYGLTDFNPGAGTSNLNVVGGHDIFVCKLDNNGNFVWAKGMGGTQVEHGTDITTDLAGNVFVTGFFIGTTDFDPSASILNITSNGADDIFILKLNTAGNLQWAKSIGGANSDMAMSITLDNAGNVYTTGFFTGTVDFNPGTSVSNLASVASIADVFVSKLDNNGNYLWAKKMGGSQADQGNSITIDANRNIFISGLLYATGDFNPGAAVYNLTTNGDSDFFITKLDSTGNFLWAKCFGSTGSDYGGELSTDINGSVYCVGKMGGPMDIDPGPGTLTINGGSFMSKLNDSGDLVWAHALPVSNAIYQSVQVDQTGNIHAVGLFMGTCDFDPGTNIFNISSVGPPPFGYTNNGFISKLSQNLCSNLTLAFDSVANVNCTNNVGYAEAVASNGVTPYSYTWNTQPPINDSIITLLTEGTYEVVVTDAEGCTRTSSILIGARAPGGVFDLETNLIAANFRTGFPTEIWLDAFNDGCIPTSGELKVVLDTLVNFNSGWPMPTSIIDDTLIWNFSNLTYDSLHLTPYFTVTTSLSALTGDLIDIQAIITPIQGDIDTTNNIKDYSFTVVNSYDPNDKQVYPKGDCVPGYITNNQLLTYTVRFQNTGNADAINIHIIDSLHAELDISTVHVLGTSHQMHTEILSGNKLNFVFNNIHLPDSGSNEVGSHGYVIFEVMPISNLNAGITIENNVGIYFDFNAPVITNTVLNTISSGNHLSPNEEHIITDCVDYNWLGQTYSQSGTYSHTESNSFGCDSISVLYLTLNQPSSSTISQTSCDSYIFNGQIYSTSGTYTQQLTNISGCDSTVTLNLIINETPSVQVTQNGTTLTATGNANFQWINCNTNTIIQGANSNVFTATQNGEYALAYTNNGCADTSICFQIFNVGIQEYETMGIGLFPNPTDRQLNITTDFPLENAHIKIQNTVGQIVDEYRNVNGKTVSLDMSRVSSGVYFIEIQDGNRHHQTKFIKR